MELLRGTKGETLTATGRLEFTVVAAGSRSEHAGPVLITAEGHGIRLYLLGDNPFENNLLRPFEGQELTVTGTWKNGVLCAKPDALAQGDVRPDEEEHDGELS